MFCVCVWLSISKLTFLPFTQKWSRLRKILSSVSIELSNFHIFKHSSLRIITSSLWSFVWFNNVWHWTWYHWPMRPEVFLLLLYAISKNHLKEPSWSITHSAQVYKEYQVSPELRVPLFDGVRIFYL